MKEIAKNIKDRQFHKVYLLTGDEGYLIYRAGKMLKDALVHPDDEMNYTRYEEGKIDLSQVADLASTFPFFSEKRLIFFQQTNILKTGKEEFLRILEQLPESTCMIICDSEVDKRSRAYQWIKKNGYVAEFLKKNQREDTLVRFVARILGEAKKKIREEDARYMVSLIGDDMFRISTETEKLISYLGEEEIVTRDSIDRIISVQIQDKIFAMVTALARKDQREALAYYKDLIVLREPPMHILYLIIRQYRILTIIKSMQAGYKSEAEIAKAPGERINTKSLH